MGAPKLFHSPPPLVVYCQVPLALFTAVTAMPEAAPLSASVTHPAISAETSVPLLLAGSSLIVFRLFAPVSTGASLIAVTFDGQGIGRRVQIDAAIGGAAVVLHLEAEAGVARAAGVGSGREHQPAQH